MKLLLILLASAKLGKVALTGGTMLLSIAVYAMRWGWPFATGFVMLIFVHEMGHFLAARQRGLNVGVPVFIPFVGAWIALKETPMSAETEAYVAIAGPFTGTLGAFAAYFYARNGGGDLFLALAYAGFFLNLINLLPLSPLDGGRITGILSPRLWFLGVPMLLALMLYQPSPVLIMIALLAVPQLLAAWRGQAPAPGYYAVPVETRVEYGVMYLGLTALLALMTFSLHQELHGGG
jgi:Zn-dependent protease